jgi:catechol 1,2-dioxygenase
MTGTTDTRVADARLGEIFVELTTAIRQVLRKHRVTWEEYAVAVEWLTRAGSDGVEIPLLMDLLFAATIDSYLGDGAEGSTESSLEGPFYLPDAPWLRQPYVLPHRDDEPGVALMFSGTVTDADGAPLSGAVLDIWQANGIGEYSHFSPGVPENNLRGRLSTDADGRFSVQTISPSPYEVPLNGPTAQLMAAVGRHTWRPGHIHVKVTHKDARPLTTQIFFAGDPYLDCDVIGAVKDQLVVSVVPATDTEPASCSYRFVLAPAVRS